MQYDTPRSTATAGRVPIHVMLVPFPIVCFIGAFLTDLTYWQSTSVVWETFSVWLLAAGLVMGGLAALAGIIDFIGSRRIRRLKPAWGHMLGNVVVLGLSAVNVMVHSRDGYTAVVPEGLILSGVVVVILLVTGWLGARLVHRHGVGVTI